MLSRLRRERGRVSQPLTPRHVAVSDRACICLCLCDSEHIRIAAMHSFGYVRYPTDNQIRRCSTPTTALDCLRTCLQRIASYRVICVRSHAAEQQAAQTSWPCSPRGFVCVCRSRHRRFVHGSVASGPLRPAPRCRLKAHDLDVRLVCRDGHTLCYLVPFCTRLVFSGQRVPHQLRQPFGHERFPDEGGRFQFLRGGERERVGIPRNENYSRAEHRKYFSRRRDAVAVA
jgi:hypothetical protein